MTRHWCNPPECRPASLRTLSMSTPTVTWLVMRHRTGSYAIFLAMAGDDLRDVTALTREQVAARVEGMGTACPVYYREALGEMAG